VFQIRNVAPDGEKRDFWVEKWSKIEKRMIMEIICILIYYYVIICILIPLCKIFSVFVIIIGIHIWWIEPFRNGHLRRGFHLVTVP